jgi:ABC-2 type transport system ATP-binding protein
MAGLLAPNEGELSWGKRRRVAFLAQDRPLYRSFSVADMLRLGRHTNRMWDEQRAQQRLHRFGVARNRKCGTLSGGEQTPESTTTTTTRGSSVGSVTAQSNGTD